MPKVSIIIPIYNSEQFLDRCILSLINQTLNDIEIILVNDASPDNSMEIVKKYAAQDSRIVIINSKVNIVASRNLGIKVAKANYLGFVDADDWVEPTMYEELYNATQKETIDVVAADVNHCFSSGRKEVEINISKEVFQNSNQVKSYVAQYGGRLFANIWKRDLITDDMLFLEHCLYCDSIVFAWYMKASSFAKVEKPLYNYYINDMSVTHLKNSERFFDRLWGAKDMFDRCKKCGLYDNYKDEIDFAFYRLYYRNTLYLIPNYFTYVPSKRIIEMKTTFNSLVELKSNKYYVTCEGDTLVKLINLSYSVGVLYIYYKRFKIIIAPQKRLRTLVRYFHTFFSKSA